MFTEWIVPSHFAGNFWITMTVIQVNILLISGILYFGRELLITGFIKLVEILSVLIFDFWDALLAAVVRVVLLPVHVLEHLLLQHVPVKKQRLKMITLLQGETYDEDLHHLISNGLQNVGTIKEVRQLERSVVQYINTRKYIDENSKVDSYEDNTPEYQGTKQMVIATE